MSVGQMAIGPVVLGGPGLDAAYQYLARTTRTKWAKKERVGKPTIHEFIGAEQDILTIEGVIYPLAARRAAVEIATHTGWGLGELLELDGEELLAWRGAWCALLNRRN